MQTVTEADVLPAGFVCEQCDRPFHPGDLAYSDIIAMTPDGEPVEGGWRCLTCWHVAWLKDG
jgi:hypothetical protein